MTLQSKNKAKLSYTQVKCTLLVGFKFCPGPIQGNAMWCCFLGASMQVPKPMKREVNIDMAVPMGGSALCV